MTTTAKGKNGQPEPEERPPPAQVQVVAQYIKDMSFENPNINKLLKDPGDTPNLQLTINVSAQPLGPDLYEFGDRVQRAGFQQARHRVRA